MLLSRSWGQLSFHQSVISFVLSGRRLGCFRASCYFTIIDGQQTVIISGLNSMTVAEAILTFDVIEHRWSKWWQGKRIIVWLERREKRLVIPSSIVTQSTISSLDWDWMSRVVTLSRLHHRLTLWASYYQYSFPQWYYWSFLTSVPRIDDDVFAKNTVQTVSHNAKLTQGRVKTLHIHSKHCKITP